MAGIAVVLDLLRKNPSLSLTGQNLHSFGLFSATVAASAAASSVAAGNLFPSRFVFGLNPRVAHCDAGAALPEDYISSTRSSSESTVPEDYISSIKSASENIFHWGSLKYTTKVYTVEQKPLFSAFHWKSLALTSLRSFLAFYLPLLEPRPSVEEDDDDILGDSMEGRHVDLVTPFKRSVKQIVRETTVVTTRRILERLAVQYVSQRLAWKLLKDVPRSAVRKAGRGMPILVYFYSVSRTTLRGHFLGVLASWLVQVGIDTWQCFSCPCDSKEETEESDNKKVERIQHLGKKVYFATVRSAASLVFAAICGGIGATLFRPKSGQWIGCAIGDVCGPFIVALCFEKVSYTGHPG